MPVNAAFQPRLLLSLCSRTVDFYGMGFVPMGCKTAAMGLSDAVCVSALGFPLTVVLQGDSIRSAICLPPGLLAAVRLERDTHLRNYLRARAYARTHDVVVCVVIADGATAWMSLAMMDNNPSAHTPICINIHKPELLGA